MEHSDCKTPLESAGVTKKLLESTTIPCHGGIVCLEEAQITQLRYVDKVSNANESSHATFSAAQD